MPRIQRRFLLHSRWTARTALAGSEGECHFEVLELHRDPAGDQVTLRAVLTDRRYRVAVATLDEPDHWLTGWQSLPPAPEPAKSPA